ncbi:unnamed protein product [Closterium sp. Naga37s-1]|nr:unnamed protein product [Closterium sp. Naga37s-1]
MLSQSSGVPHWEAEESGARDAAAAGMAGGGMATSAPMLAPLYPSISMDAHAVELASYILFPPPPSHGSPSLRSLNGSAGGTSAPSSASAAAQLARQAEAEEPLLFAERISAQAQARGGLAGEATGGTDGHVGREGAEGGAEEGGAGRAEGAMLPPSP